MDAAGIWHGTYRYEHEDGASSVDFTMRVSQDAGGTVTGTVTDGPGGMPEEGRIIGTCRLGRLTADGRTVAGTWRLDGCVVPLRGGQTAHFAGARGVWSATRADA